MSDCWLLVIRAVQVIECKEVCEALFNEGRAFKPESGCYTAALLRSLTGPQRDMGMGWPSGAQPDLTGPKAYAKSLFKMVSEFLDVNFPMHSWRSKFGAFNCGPGAFPEKFRLRCIGELAAKEGLSHDATNFFGCLAAHETVVHRIW